MARRLGLDDQRIRFALVGAWNTGSSYAMFVALELGLGDRVHYLILLVVTMVASVLQAFVLHRRWVFRAEGPWLGQFWRFAQVYAGTLALNLVLLPLLVEVVGLPVLLAQALLVVTTVVMSFLGHRSYTFGR